MDSTRSFGAKPDFSWGAFAERDALTASDDGIVVNVQASAVDGTTNGGFGVGTGELEIDFDAYQMEVRLRPTSENVASTFRVIINEVDTPATGESYQYHFDLLDLEEDEWTTLSVPLSSPSTVWTEGGDGVPEDGIRRASANDHLGPIRTAQHRSRRGIPKAY